MLRAIKMPSTIMTFSEVDLLLLVLFLAIRNQVSCHYNCYWSVTSDGTFSNKSPRHLCVQAPARS